MFSFKNDMQKERDGSMSASFNPKDWFVEEPRKENKTVSQASNSQKQQRQQKQNTVSSYFCPWCNKTYVVPSETITCPVCHKTFFEAFATQSGEKKISLSKELEPFRPWITRPKTITPKMAKSFAAQLNPRLCSRKKLVGFLTLAMTAVGIYFALVGLPIFLIPMLIFVIWNIKLSGRYSTLTKTIRALKSPEKVQEYIQKLTVAPKTDLPFRYDQTAVYNADNAVFSVDNICLIYTSGRQVYFGTMLGELVKFGEPCTKEQQNKLIEILTGANPHILLGAEYMKFVTKLIGK